MEAGWKGFLKLCKKAKNVQQLDKLLELFLTASEREDLATRYLIVQELLSGRKTQREIAEDLGVSIAKITRGSNYLKLIDDKVIKFVEG